MIKDVDITQVPRYNSSEIARIMEVNLDFEVEHNVVEGLEYLKIKNFLKYPEELKEFLLKFPCEDRTMSLESGETQHITGSKAPGFQQPIPTKFFSTGISHAFHAVLKQNNMIKYDEKRCTFMYYTNCFYPKMPAYKTNYLPHVDPFTYALNLFLTDVEDTYTDFFKMKIKDTYVYQTSELYKHPKEHYDDLVTRLNREESFSKWKVFEENEIYKRYHRVPAEYNCATVYRGNRWHSAGYDAENETKTRYSLVGVIN